MQRTVLIPEKGGNGNSAMAKDNREEVKRVETDDECNKLLEGGWGVLSVLIAQYYDERVQGIMYKVIYIMYHTVTAT